MHEVDNENDLFPVTRASEISGESVSQSWLIEDLWTSSAVGWIAGTPKSYKSWTALEMAVSWAESIGPSTAQLVSSIMASRPHPEQGFRACLGILRLSKRDGAERLEKASLRAVLSGSLSFRSVCYVARPPTSLVASTMAQSFRSRVPPWAPGTEGRNSRAWRGG